MTAVQEVVAKEASKHPPRYFLVESGGRGRESFSGEPFPMW
jgi:hypothetical protein